MTCFADGFSVDGVDEVWLSCLSNVRKRTRGAQMRDQRRVRYVILKFVCHVLVPSIHWQLLREQIEHTRGKQEVLLCAIETIM